MAIVKQGSTTLNSGSKGDKGDMPSFTINGESVVDGSVITVVSGDGNANLRTVLTLADLQAVLTGEIAEIQGDVDLVNTVVVLPTDVYLKDGGGSIITSGTATLKTSEGSTIDNSILNAGLNWDGTSIGYLTNPILTFNLDKFPIDETIDTAITASNVTAGMITATQTNIDNINKAIEDCKLFNGYELFIPKLDCFIQNSRPTTGEWYEKNLVEQDAFSIRLPSNFTIRMSDDVFIRSLPSYAYAQNIISSLNTKKVKVIGGNLIGSRLSHNYRQHRFLYSPSSGSSIDYTIGTNDALITYTIAITPNDAQAQVEEISDYINANVELQGLGYSSVWGSNVNGLPFFDVINSTDGLYFRSYGSTANGYSEYTSGYDITYELGVVFIGVDTGIIDGTTIKDCQGDGIVASGNGLSTSVGYRNSRLITVINCTLDNNRRNNISPIGVETMLIENNYIINAGQDMGVNLGSAPRLGIDTEPTRYRDGVTGETLDENLVRGVVITNNYFLDNLFGSVNLYSSYDSWATNNVANTRMAAQQLQGGGLINNVIDFNIGLGGAENIIGQTGIQTVAMKDIWTSKIEVASQIVISGNIIRGKGASATLDETGMNLQGWKVNCNDNIIKNINGYAFALGSLRDSNIHHNTVDAEPSVTNSGGLEMLSSVVRDVHFDYNNIRTQDYALNLSNINSSAAAASINMTVGVPSLFLTGNTFESVAQARMIGGINVSFINNLFKTSFKFRNVITDLVFKGNTCEDGLVLTSSATYTDCYFTDNDIHSKSTVAAIEVNPAGVCDNVNFVGNRLYQPSGGLRAFYIHEISGGTVDNFTVIDTKLMIGSPTEFITFAGDNSFFLNNWNIRGNSSTSQTITGASNTIDGVLVP